MAKNGKKPGWEKKSMTTKKQDIEKLVKASKKSPSLNTIKQPVSKFILRFPTPQANVSAQTMRKGQGWHPQGRQRLQTCQVPRILPPKQVVPGLPEPSYLILDRRSPESPTRPLVRLPFESGTPRALRYGREGVFPFLELPGEIRNQIYDLAVAKDNYQLAWVNNNHKSKSLTYRHPGSTRAGPVLPKDTAHRRRSLDVNYKPKAIREHLPVDYYGPIPTTLLLVNNRTHDEAASVFYAKSTFHFDALGTLRHFLDQLTPIAMKSITSLALRYRAYGNPQFTDNRIWKSKHDRLWDDLCWRVADECNLQRLQLDLTLNISPVKFCSLDDAEFSGMAAAWMRPLWAFQDINLERCWARIRCPSKDDSVLEVASWNLRKDILGEEAWNDEVESKRDAFGYRKNGKKAANPMVLSVNAPMATATQHRPGGNRGPSAPRRRWPRIPGAKISPAWGSFFPPL